MTVKKTTTKKASKKVIKAKRGRPVGSTPKKKAGRPAGLKTFIRKAKVNAAPQLDLAKKVIGLDIKDHTKIELLRSIFVGNV